MLEKLIPEFLLSQRSIAEVPKATPEGDNMGYMKPGASSPFLHHLMTVGEFRVVEAEEKIQHFLHL